MTLLNVQDLSVSFGRKQALYSVSFQVEPGQRVGLIGESGSGKSVTALALMGLLGDSASVSGSATLDGKQLLNLSDRALSRVRGREVGMVFQEPMSALDPTMRVGRQVSEVSLLRTGTRADREEVAQRLVSVGLADPVRVAASYPHQLSGGQRQRVLLAMALVAAPKLLICDEPTTALDVTVQAKVLELLNRELDEAQSACLFISHDLAVVSQVCRYVLVMYRGKIVERGDIQEVLSSPKHPYTRGLLATANIAGAKPGERLPVLSDYWEGA